MVGPYKDHGLCPVNVHWHLGAEHRSAGEFDEDGSGPHHSDDDHGATDAAHRQLAGDVRQGLQCHHYDELDPKFTSHYDWKHCVGMEVGETYEVHWPHSAAGMCGTVHQYQTPFYDGPLPHRYPQLTRRRPSNYSSNWRPNCCQVSSAATASSRSTRSTCTARLACRPRSTPSSTTRTTTTPT